YTSGSTGRPKGVMGVHRSLANFVRALAGEIGLGRGDRLLLFAPLTFDASALQIFPTLTSGAALVLHRNPTRLASAEIMQLCARQHVTVLDLPAALWRQWVDEMADGGPGLPSRLRAFLTGGEKLSADRLRRWAEFAPRDARFLSSYGPTEATVTTTWFTLTAGEVEPGTASVPLGRPLANTRVHLLDPRQEPVPIGVPGELHIGGRGLTRGYLGRPDATALAFVPDPFCAAPGERLYRTGDLARRLPDGYLEFLGRADHQVKIRGFRIELGEIEEVLRLHPLVGEAVVTAPPGPGGERRLVAYVVPRQAGTAAAAEAAAAALKAYLGDRLPKFMVPYAFLFLEELPRSRSGKLDRSALPTVAAVAAVRPAAAGRRPPRTELERQVAEVWREALGLEEVGADESFFDLGGHSLLLARVHGRLREITGADLPLIDLFTYPTVGTLAEHLHRLMGRASEPAAPPLVEDLPPVPAMAGGAGSTGIAVIGMALRVPGAVSLDDFWRNLCGGVESISFFSQEELLAAGAPAELLRDPHYVRARGVLQGVELFDAALFRIQPRQAALMDPQHRIFLECLWEALESAGYDPETAGRSLGLFAGAGVNSYSFRFHQQPVGETDLMQVILNNEKDHLATRASYLLNLEGPSVTVQSSCSTSLVAVHLACQSLLAGDCGMALAGGVSIDPQARSGYLYQEGGILSPDGHCRAFDAAARGTVSGSGAGVVVLKRLDDALRDGDTIHAVIRGSAINNDGALKVGYTAPRVEGQARVIREAQRRAGVRPDEITHIEAHGTGTELGDPIEMAALKQAFRAGTDRVGFCAVTSLKTNIGHLDAAAGVVGLIKAALSLRHRTIPPSLHFERPNPALGLEGSPFYINDRLRPWEVEQGPRRAGVSSFGIGGTNAHVVLEEAPETTADPAGVPARPCQLLLLSARSESALEVATDNLARHLESHPEVDLADVAYTLQVGRRTFPWRRVAVCRDRGEAAALLAQRETRRVTTGRQDRQGLPVTFLFPGQGAQHVGMGRELYDAEPLFRHEIDRCAEILLPSLGIDLRQVLYPVPGEEDAAAGRLNTMTFCQPALFAVEHSLGRMWMAWLGEPQAMIGHSVGEYAAACLAGVFSLQDALTLVAARGRLMDETGEGVMLAVPLAEADLLPRLGPELAIAAINGPERCVVSGPREATALFEERLDREGISCRLLHVPGAFHGPAVDSILDRFAAEVRSVSLRQPRIRYVSTLSGTWIEDQEATDPAYWVRHLRRTVRFSPGLVELWREVDGPMLEVGPGRTLTALVNQHPGRPVEREVLSSLRHPREQASDLEIVMSTLGRLWLQGGRVDWAAVHDGERRRRLPLPTYPFERQRYWIDERIDERIGGRRPARPAEGLIGSGGAWLLAGPATEASRGFARHLAAVGARLALALAPARLGIELATERERLVALEAELDAERPVECMSDLPG
ncbi:MAG TPA: amino acid adenylation domain-containing protein, partial [Thermoanaerobaculia bacterium]|nr:amino acid adenylation domain-containing protein [Thermoanaerobaculia bacterium]